MHSVVLIYICRRDWCHLHLVETFFSLFQHLTTPHLCSIQVLNLFLDLAVQFLELLRQTGRAIHEPREIPGQIFCMLYNLQLWHWRQNAALFIWHQFDNCLSVFIGSRTPKQTWTVSLTVSVDYDSTVGVVDVCHLCHGLLSCILIHLCCFTHLPQFALCFALHLWDQTLESAARRAFRNLWGRTQGFTSVSERVYQSWKPTSVCRYVAATVTLY